MARYIFLDLETTGLESGTDQITEAAWILDDGTERQFFVKHDRLPNEWVLTKSDYLNRIVLAQKVELREALEQLAGDCYRLTMERAAYEVVRETALGPFTATEYDEAKIEKVYLVGACPAFDDRFLRVAFGGNPIPYNYHVIDVEAMAMGLLGQDAPGSLKSLREALGIPGENPAAHTALSDAREVKIIFEAIRARAPVAK